MSNDWQIVPKDDLRTVLALAWDAHPSRVSIETIWRIEKLLNAPASPVAGDDARLEDDVRVGSVIIRKGCKVSTLTLAARRAYQQKPQPHPAMEISLTPEGTESQGLPTQAGDDAATVELLHLLEGAKAASDRGRSTFVSGKDTRYAVCDIIQKAIQHISAASPIARTDERVEKLERVYEIAKRYSVVDHPDTCALKLFPSAPNVRCDCGKDEISNAIKEVER